MNKAETMPKIETATATPVAITLIEAITQAMAYEMRHDDSVVVLGEDVGVNGGVFRATAGLQQTFGSQRVLDTPLDETTIAGLTVGLASQGMKPVAESQFDGFVYPMVDHIICHAARFRYRNEDEVKAAWTREPIMRLRNYLTAQGVWSEGEEAAWAEECGKKVDIEINAYLETPVQPVEAMFDYLYADPPPDLLAQRAAAIALEKRNG